MHYLHQNLLADARPLTAIHKTEYRAEAERRDFHPHYELYFCPSACGQTVILNGHPYPAERPCAVLVRPYTVHHTVPKDPGAPFERYVVYFGEAFADGFSDWIFDTKILAHSGIFFLKDSEALLDILMPVMDAARPMGERGAHLAAFFARMEICIAGKAALVPSEDTIGSILERILAHPGGKFDADGLASEFHISRAKLDRDFRRYAGCSLHQTVMNCRLQTASELLKNTRLPIAEVARRCGFENEQYFFRFFRRHTGRTPGEFRYDSIIADSSEPVNGKIHRLPEEKLTF